MNAILLLAMMQVSPPAQDTLVVRVPLPSPEPVSAVAPPVTVNVNIQADSLFYARGAEDAERAIALKLAHENPPYEDPCGCGVPGWAYAGLIVIGAAAVGALWYHVVKTHQDDDDDDDWLDDGPTGGPTEPPPPPPPGTQPPPPPPSHPHGHQPGNSGHGKGKKP